MLLCLELMRLFRDSIRCNESAASIVGPCSNSVTGIAKSGTCLVRTKAEIKSKEVNNL